MALAFDPDRLPVLRTDHHLPAVPADLMSADALRRRFADPPRWEPDTRTEQPPGARTPVSASVLIGLIGRDEPVVLFTRRTDHLSAHAGQISFPGGRAEPADADAAATALREAHEEIGVESGFIEVLGTMPSCATGSGFVVTPVVAWLRAGFTLRPEPNEVADVFEVPLAFLMNPANHRRHAGELRGVQRELLSISFDGIGIDGRPRRYVIWGVTAALLRNLYRFLSA